MKPLLSHLLGRVIAGDLLSSGVSAAVLAWRGRAETGSAAAPINAVSHWLGPRRALRQDAASARYPLPGPVVHFAAAALWSSFYEALRGRRSEPTPTNAVTDAIAVTAVAAVVDLAC